MRLKQADETADYRALLTLIQESFAYMKGRIDPPSSMYRLTPESLRQMAEEHEIWVVEQNHQIIGCMVLQDKQDTLYLGKVTVQPALQGCGVGRRLLECAESRALAQGKAYLELETRIELIENHRAFRAWGFEKIAETSHPGFDRPTSITMRKKIST